MLRYHQIKQYIRNRFDRWMNTEYDLLVGWLYRSAVIVDSMLLDEVKLVMIMMMIIIFKMIIMMIAMIITVVMNMI